MENPIKMDDLGVPLFSETAIWMNVSFLLFFQLLTKVRKQGKALDENLNKPSLPPPPK